MTAVIAIDYLYGFMVLADTRVTYESDKTYDEKHGVQKIFPFTTDGRTLGVIGFAGPLGPAKTVLEFVFEHKIKNLSKPIVIEQFGEDLCKWLKQASFEVKDAEKLQRLKIMFCGSDARRRQRGKKGNKLELMPFYSWHCFTYRFGHSGNVIRKKTRKSPEVIGSGEKLKESIRAATWDIVMAEVPEPLRDNFRRVYVSTQISESFIHAGEKTVGGVWQIIQYTPLREPYVRYIWPDQSLDEDIEVEKDKNGVLNVRHLESGQSQLIMPLTSWVSSNKRASLDLYDTEGYLFEF
jgi:hypothetical protein